MVHVAQKADAEDCAKRAGMPGGVRAGLGGGGRKGEGLGGEMGEGGGRIVV